MSQIVPLFPLPMIVFPGEEVNLHIFEPRYKQLIGECRDQDLHFAIPPFINNKLMPIATEMELVSISKVYPKGEMDVTVRAIRQLRIREYYTEAPDKLYPGGECKPFIFTENSDIFFQQDIHRMLQSILTDLPYKGKLPDNPAELEIHKYVHLVGMNVTDMYEMYEAPQERDRQQLFLQHLKQVMPRVRKMEELKRKVRMNGHFKNVIPPRV
ncbi:MAG: peptidase [Bacteroidetes bacterium]|nr:peptidase [Bacteroidota bacterium]